MNHKVRAKGIVHRALPPKLVIREGTRTLRIDVTAWQQDLVKAVARGLRQAERDARRSAIVDAADAVVNLRHLKPRTDVESFHEAAYQEALDAIMELQR